MSHARRSLGKAGEDLVAQEVQSRGWRLLGRNVRTARGEIDLIAFDGSSLVFIEVKSAKLGSLTGPEHPALAVGPRKQARLRRLAREWLSLNRPPTGCRSIRFDVVGITYDRSGRPVAYDHLRDAF